MVVGIAGLVAALTIVHGTTALIRVPVHPVRLKVVANAGSRRVRQAVNGHKNALVTVLVFGDAIPVAGNFVRPHPVTGITVSAHQMVDTMIHAPNAGPVSPTVGAMVPYKNHLRALLM